MDPLTHVALGRVLASVPEQRVRGCVGAAVLGALAPDLDVVLMPFGWDRYLRVHEAWTHSIPGTVVCALLVGLVVGRFRRPAPFRPLFLFAWSGTLSHVALDLLSSARHRVAWPFSDGVVSLPAVAMADPWLLAICAGGSIAVLAARSATRSKRAAYSTVAVAATFLAVKGALGTSAFAGYRAARDSRGEIVEARVIEAAWGRLTTWNVLDRTPQRLRFWRAGALQAAEEVFTWPLVPESALVRRSRSLSTVRNFLRSHDLTFAVELSQAEDRTLILWSDIRFCSQPEMADSREPIVTAANGHRLTCGLWFGGEFDEHGRPIRELVRIGRLLQERAPAP